MAIDSISSKKIKNNSAFILTFIFLLICSHSQDFIDAQPNFIQPQTVKPVQKSNIIEANHFYSSTDKTIDYNIVSIDKSQSLFIIPKNQQNSPKVAYSNQITLNLNDNNGNMISCTLQDNYQLCVLKRFNSDAIKMTIKCQNLPCQFSWVVIQSIVQVVDTKDIQKTGLKELYQVQQSSNDHHLTIKLTCDNPQLTTRFHNQLKLYANRNNYIVTKTDGITYILFSNPPTLEKEYLYLRIKQDFRTCAKISLDNAVGQIKMDTLYKDFIIHNKTTAYKLINPKNHMRIDFSLHQFSQQTTLSGNIKIQVVGTKNGKTQIISQMFAPMQKKKYIQFSFAVNKISQQYSNIEVHFDTSQVEAIINFKMVVGEIQLVQKGEFSFFSLKKGEKIKYKLIQETTATKSSKSYIFISDQKKAKLSKNTCSSLQGCQFQLEALQDYDGSIYIGQSQVQNTQEIVSFQIDKTFTKRVNEDTKIYLKKKIKNKKSYQVLVNTHNVILYAAQQTKCPKLGLQCHQKAGNAHHPFIYESEKDGILVILVHSLDSTEFTITILQQGDDYIQLKDSQPFMYLMDDAETQLKFKFQLQSKQDLTFTLVSPVNELILYAFNGKQVPAKYKDKAELFTSDGYIFISKQDINSNDFVLVVRKMQGTQKQFIHFTLIASTKNANIKLQTGVTHHQKLTKGETQDFVLQFIPQRDYIISFYIHNTVDKKIQVSLELSGNDKYQKDNPFSFTIDKMVDKIDIDDYAKKICKKEEQTSCQIFLRLRNKMSIDLQISLTLLSMNSIVEATDGIWQYFPQEQISTTTNFYFYPKHLNPINIIYKSTNPDLRLVYSLIKMDDKNINPIDWPFPKYIKDQKATSLLDVKRVRYININKATVNSCWPNCLLLVSLINAQSVESQFQQFIKDKTFGLLISNNLIDLPQKTKIDLTLQKNQDKYIKIDMKYALKKNVFTFFIYDTIGQAQLYANVCSQKNMRFPTKQENDFSFGILQTQLRMSTIKAKFKDFQIQEGQNPYFCIYATSDQNTKCSIQFNSDEDIIKLLNMDQYQTVSLQSGVAKYYQISAQSESTIKITRTKGFPFIFYKKCDGKSQDFEECLAQEEDQKEQKKDQLIQKMRTIFIQPCEKCIVYLKLSADEPAQLDVHVQSKYTQIQLKQKHIISDTIQKGEQNRYQINALSNQETVININVEEGAIKVHVSDLNSIQLSEESSSKKNNLQFVIKPTTHQDSKQKSLKLSDTKQGENTFIGGINLSAFGLSTTWNILHVQIQSIDPQKRATYTIQYSSGERESFLQDGLVYSYKLQSDKQNINKFFYQNYDEHSHAYVFINTDKSSDLKNLQISFYSMQNAKDDENKKQITFSDLQMRKKSQNPTILYPLPTNKFYSIQIKNPTGKDIQVSIGVNHEQVILLPFDIDFPLPLHNDQEINLIVNTKNKGYILLTVRKCDESNPQLSYTFDYQGFKNKEFQYTSTLDNQPKFQYLIKTKQSPLYINIKREQIPQTNQGQFKQSIISVNARFSSEKMKTDNYLKAGNKGLMDYKIQASDQFLISFTEVTCQAKSSFCSHDFQYYLVAADNMIDAYSQTVCPSTYFATPSLQQAHKLLPVKKIVEKADSNHKINFKYKLQKSSAISYIAIKAVYRNKQNEMIEIFYQPIQIVSLWGQFQKASNKHGWTLVGVAVIGFCFFLICVRRQKKKGYQPLQAND